jgi:hypothetical protein
MTIARLRLIGAAVLFVGWLGWLGYAVWNKGTVQIVSRAQLTAATHLVVAEVAVGPDGQPLPRVTVTEVIQAPEGDQPTGELEVERLPSAMTPLPVVGETRTPPAGMYLLPLVKTDAGRYRLAGLPASPGYPPREPDRPRIYPWTADVQTQLRKVGILK